MPIKPVLACLFSAAVSGLACSPAPPAPKPETPVYRVSPSGLYRDHQTAHSFVGHWVRVTLTPDYYTVRGSELLVYCADNGAPPVITFKLNFPFVFVGKQPTVTVTGIVTSVERDGHWRSRLVDFSVTVEQCTVEVGP